MSKYKEFRKVNKDFQSRIEAFTSGLLTPDPKGITLWSMDPSKAYTHTELYNQVRSFCDLEEFPLTLGGVWRYCGGNGKYRGSLEAIGAVVKLRIKKIYNVPVAKEEYVIAYQKNRCRKRFRRSHSS